MRRNARISLVLVGLMIFSSGLLSSCALTRPAPPEIANQYKLVLLKPEIEGRMVTINGVHNFGQGIYPVWNWGDGSFESPRIFPAKHTYKNPGTYTVRLEIGIITFSGRIDATASTDITIE